MKRKDNVSYEMFEIKQDIDYYSNYLSEGNSYLEECLKLIWKLNYKTAGCCVGHSTLDMHPYILFYTLDRVEHLKLLDMAQQVTRLVKEVQTVSYIKNDNYMVCLSSEDIDNKLFVSLKFVLEKEYNNMEEIKFEFTGIVKENNEVATYCRLPKRSTKASAGYDFYNPVRVEIEPHSMKLVRTGIKAKFPQDMTLKLYNRSSNPKKKGVMLANGVGIVDSDYYGNPDNDGEIGFMFYNFTDTTTVFEVGDKLGQGIFEKYYTLTNEDEITTERTGGFGSTGN